MRLIQTNLAALVGASRVRVNHALDFFRKRNMMSHDSDGHITVLAADTFAQRAR